MSSRLQRWVGAVAFAAAAAVMLGGAAPTPASVLAAERTVGVVQAQVAPLRALAEQVPPPAAAAPLTGADLAALPLANRSDATAIIPDLPVDPNPDGEVTGERVRVVEPTPVYAEPGGEPVALLEPTTVLSETVLPVFDRDGRWVMVPVLARTGLPSDGVVGQAVGWVWAGVGAGVEVHEDTTVIRVDRRAETLTVVDGDEELLTVTVGVGKPATPTPVGRTAIAAVYDDPDVAYLGGRPVHALTRFSDEVDSFRPSGTAAGTQAPPLVAIHAYTTGPTVGAVSNGCLRLTGDDLAAVAELVEVGTPVIVTG